MILSNLKQFVKQNILFISSIFLAILCGYGIGLLTITNTDSPIVIQQLEQTASIQEAVSDIVETEGTIVGSKNSNKYHHPDCPWAKKISEKNIIKFDSIQAAVEAGYTPCKSFEKYNH